MKMTRVLSTAMLFVLPGAIATLYAQEHEEKPAEHQQQAKPAQKQQEAKPAQKQEAQHKPAAKPAQQHAASTEKAKPAEKSQHAARTPQAKPAQQKAAGHQEQASRGGTAGRGHGSIPEARYNASFGSSHTFHVNQSEFSGGSGRFQYGGYWFNAVNPWPVGWLYTDAVYVAYLNGGYFLCNPFHPGVYISINIG
jgi:hemolysin activation/secretion protein